MEEDRNPFYGYIQRLLAYPRRLLVTIFVGNESVNVIISVLVTSIFIAFLGIDGKWAAIAATTITLLIVGETIPKTFAVNFPIRFSTAVSLPLSFFFNVVRPVIWLLEKISDFFVFLFWKTVKSENTVLTEDEFRTLVDVGYEEGALEESQKDMIHRVFDLADTTVEDIMTPRVDMFCLPLSMTAEEMTTQILEARYSRIPVYGTDRDDIIGVLHARHMLEKIAWGETVVSFKSLLKKPYYVPLERSAESILRDFKMRRIQMAFVVDEYGGIEGLVTLNDIMEGLVGEIYDEYDVKKRLFHRLDDGSLLVSGMMEVDDFNALARVNIPVEEFDTVGGFVLHLFGELPAKEEAIKYDRYTIRIEKVTKTRIVSVRVMRNNEDRSE